MVDRNEKAQRNRERELKRLVDVATEAIYDPVRNAWSLMGQSLLRQKAKCLEDINSRLEEIRGVRECIRETFLSGQGARIRVDLQELTLENCTPLLTVRMCFFTPRSLNI